MDTALLVAVACLTGADIGVSLSALSTGGYREVNPLLSTLDTHPAAYGAVKAGITAGAVIGIWKATARKPRARLWALAGMVAIQAIVVGVNVARYRGGV